MPDPLQSVRDARVQFVKDMEEAMQVATNQASVLLTTRMIRYLSLLDHNAKDLQRLKYPYSPRFPMGHLHKDWYVHQQTGDLVGGIRRIPADKQGDVIRAEIHSHAPYTWFLLLGTRKMRPRDFVTAALYETQEEIGKLYRTWHELVHDRYRKRRFTPDMVPILRIQYPAQLPEKD